MSKDKKKIILKNAEELELMRQSAQLVSRTLGEVAKVLKPGVTPLELDKLAHDYILDNGGKPGFLGLYGCPSTLLISVNDVIIHGLPDKTAIQEGDIVSVDCGVLMNEYYGDHAYTFAVGEIAPETQKLLDVTQECLYLAIDQVKRGNRVGDIGYTVQVHAEKNGFSVVREFVGHGLGQKLHEAPEVPNYGRRGQGPLLEEGMTIAIEPMINQGKAAIKRMSDGWTIKTKDGKPSAHFEHDVALVNGAPYLLSTFRYIEEALGLPLTR